MGSRRVALFSILLAAALIHPASARAGTNGGAFRSRNGGQSWTAVNAGLTTYAHALAIDPWPPARLYAGRSGVDRREVGAHAAAIRRP